MIILSIPKKVGDRDLTNFITLQIKKFRKNQRHKYIRLGGEVAYSNNHVYLVLPNRGLELAFALSILFKCQKHGVPCELHLSKQFKLEEVPREIVEAAKIWSERKLPRKYYSLRGLGISL